MPENIRLSARISRPQLIADCEIYRSDRFEALSLEWFVQPVSLIVEGTELFADDDGSLLQFSLVHAAANLEFDVRRAIKYGHCRFDLTLAGQQPLLLSIDHTGTRIEFSRGPGGVTASAAIEAVLQECSRFNREIRQLLLEVCPKLAQGEPWAEWFAGDDMAGRAV